MHLAFSYHHTPAAQLISERERQESDDQETAHRDMHSKTYTVHRRGRNTSPGHLLVFSVLALVSELSSPSLGHRSQTLTEVSRIIHMRQGEACPGSRTAWVWLGEACLCGPGSGAWFKVGWLETMHAIKEIWGVSLRDMGLKRVSSDRFSSFE